MFSVFFVELGQVVPERERDQITFIQLFLMHLCNEDDYSVPALPLITLHLKTQKMTDNSSSTAPKAPPT